MHSKTKKSLRQLIILLCVVIILCGGIYTAVWYADRSRIEDRNAEYRRLYQSAATLAPSQHPTLALPTASPTVTPTDAPTRIPTAEPLPAVEDHPLATPDSDTIVISLPTAPPVQESFSDLLKLNPETIGFLNIDDLISLPVVQKENDNSFYLDHNFEQSEAAEGTLFLDGMNRLNPEDDCLIIYGHNMHNGTMFGELDHYDELDFLKSHPLVQFDTIYENRTYVPIAAFPASMNPDSSSYFDVRQIVFDNAADFDLFLMRLKSRSVLDIPVDAYYGDSLLLLVTCDYTKDDGRFILALRRLRDGETTNEVIELINNSK